jgi:hypothetical protein
MSLHFGLFFPALFFIAALLSLFFNWAHHEARTHIVGALVCFVIADIFDILYFIPEINAFSKMSPDAELTPELIGRVTSWRRWSI